MKSKDNNVYQENMIGCHPFVNSIYYVESEWQCCDFRNFVAEEILRLRTLKDLKIFVIYSSIKNGMLGHIHLCMKELVLNKMGEETWERVLETTQCDNSRDFLLYHNYPDSIFFKLLTAVANELNVTTDDALEAFGKQFFKYTKRLGYHKMIENLGGDMRTFVENLDTLHEYFAITQKSMVAPSFSIDKINQCEMILHYNSSRKGLYPWIKGMLGCIAKEIFKTDIRFKIVTNATDNNPETRFKQHMVIIIQSECSTHRESLAELDKSICNRFRPVHPNLNVISARNMVNCFPYHIVFDFMLSVKQSGFMLQQLCEPLHNDSQQVSLPKVATLVKPVVPFDTVSIRRFINSPFTFAFFSNYKHLVKENDSGGILVRGQIILLEDQNSFLFIGSPRIMTLIELEEKNLYLSDIPVYDVTRELLLVNEQRLAEMEISKHMNEMTNQLQKTTGLLEEEKTKVNVLLSRMLPPRVAQQLLNGKRVEAEKFHVCTILFSDIVNFTNIASQCSPMDVIDMLNALYLLFDKATEDNKAYKVETIGDAYMVVAGVPDVISSHAEIIAEQAMDMILASSKVKSPVNGKALQIRVGIHSGPVVAGVVGEKMPRFCLFGDTVNVASRMESHGIPQKIHCSSSTYQFLVAAEYQFDGRGEVEIKGKGLMKTYFLLGRGGGHRNGERILYGKDYSQRNVRVFEDISLKKGKVLFVLKENVSSMSTAYKSLTKSVLCCLV